MDSKHIINLSGRDYVLYAGLLAEAHAQGLQALTTELVQIPSAENDYVAIVEAKALLTDGRVFSDYGDASPRNCKAHLATALIRLASTRAKGRTLRDAVNIGVTMYEELPDLDEAPESAGDRRAAAPPAASRAVQAAERERVTDRGDPPGANGNPACSECGKALTRGQHEVSTRGYGRPLCPEHQKGAAKLSG